MLQTTTKNISTYFYQHKKQTTYGYALIPASSLTVLLLTELHYLSRSPSKTIASTSGRSSIYFVEIAHARPSPAAPHHCLSSTAVYYSSYSYTCSHRRPPGAPCNPRMPPAPAHAAPPQAQRGASSSAAASPALLRILYCIKLGFLYRLNKQINERVIYEKAKPGLYDSEAQSRAQRTRQKGILPGGIV